jgi:hypothetical protein
MILLVLTIISSIIFLISFIIGILINRDFESKREKRAPTSCLFFVSMLLSLLYLYLLVDSEQPLINEEIINLRFLIYVFIYRFIFEYTSITFKFDSFLVSNIESLVVISHSIVTVRESENLTPIIYLIIMSFALFRIIAYRTNIDNYYIRIKILISMSTLFFFLILLIPNNDNYLELKSILYVFNDLYLIFFCFNLLVYPYELYMYQNHMIN